jgi:adenylylsulfate kinase
MQGMVVWITGRPASGKSTLARCLVEALRARGTPHLWLDGDDLRPVLTPRADYGDEDRARFYGALGHLARLGADGGTLVIVSATASRRAFRDAVRAAVPRFVEVYLVCDEARLFARDPKGLYRAQREGRVRALPGMDAPYEAPLAAELTLDSGREGSEALAQEVLRFLDGDRSAEPEQAPR